MGSTWVAHPICRKCDYKRVLQRGEFDQAGPTSNFVQCQSCLQHVQFYTEVPRLVGLFIIEDSIAVQSGEVV